MKIYAMSDIHGCYDEFIEALDKINITDEDSKLILLGDYIHNGPNGKEVIDKIIELQDLYGDEKIIALKGNHEDFVLTGEATLSTLTSSFFSEIESFDTYVDSKYIDWIESLPDYHVEGNTIFVHAGIDEDAGDLWEIGTPTEWLVHKYPADTGKINGLDKKIVAGHVGTCELANDESFHEIYYDGESHYYIDGTTHISGIIPIIMVDTENDKYYDVTNYDLEEISPYVN